MISNRAAGVGSSSPLRLNRLGPTMSLAPWRMLGEVTLRQKLRAKTSLAVGEAVEEVLVVEELMFSVELTLVVVVLSTTGGREVVGVTKVVRVALEVTVLVSKVVSSTNFVEVTPISVVAVTEVVSVEVTAVATSLFSVTVLVVRTVEPVAALPVAVTTPTVVEMTVTGTVVVVVTVVVATVLVGAVTPRQAQAEE